MRCGPVLPAPDRIPAELADRFWEALTRNAAESFDLGLAVSGGSDSLAMLLLAQAVIPGQFQVATVNHGLRPEAADECRVVADLCDQLGVTCDVLNVSVAPGNVQDQARRSRYEALGRWADQHQLCFIATAHHADDQAETVLMRLARGSGLAGLVGIRECRWMDWPRAISLIRPVLGFRQAELRHIVDAAGVAYVKDPSNDDDRFDRVRIRRILAAADWIDASAIARSAANLAEADRALAAYTREIWFRDVSREGDVFRIANARAISPAILMRLVEQILTETEKVARGGEIDRLIDRLMRDESGNLGGVLATAEGGDWLFRPEPPRRTG